MILNMFNLGGNQFFMAEADIIKKNIGGPHKTHKRTMDREHFQVSDGECYPAMKGNETLYVCINTCLNDVPS
jgi:hypothetical protein